MGNGLRYVALSQLFFADDLLLFCKASRDQAIQVKKTLSLFCHYSGQKINEHKSQIFFSPNVPDEVTLSICANMGWLVWMIWVFTLICLFCAK